MSWKNEFILIVLIICLLLIPAQGKSFVDGVNVFIKSIDFERDDFIFGAKYYVVVDYDIINNGSESQLLPPKGGSLLTRIKTY